MINVKCTVVYSVSLIINTCHLAIYGVVGYGYTTKHICIVRILFIRTNPRSNNVIYMVASNKLRSRRRWCRQRLIVRAKCIYTLAPRNF